MVAYAAAQLVATTVASEPRDRKPKLTLEETGDVLEDLFGGGAQQKKRRATGQTHRGRMVTTTAAVPIAAPTKIDGQLVYQNGKPVNQDDLSMFRAYQEAHRGEAPFSQEAMTGWFYR